jgi:hypothetical protein
MAWHFYAPFSDDEIEFIRQQIAKAKRKPGQPKQYHGWEWAWQFERIYAELLERFECYHVDGDSPPSKLEACQQVARDDFATHRERWPDYEPDERPDKAARRVWMAIQEPLAANERVRNRLNKR